MHSPTFKTLAASVTGLILPASLLLAVGVAAVVEPLMRDATEAQNQAAFVGCGLIALSVGGAVWGRTLARVAGVQSIRRITLVSALSYCVLTVLLVVVLSGLEARFVGEGPSPLPLHYLYTVLFVPAAFLGAALMGGALGLALRDVNLAGRLAWQGGLAAALTYLICNVLQDVLGRRVGGPNAAETATMITVTLVCYGGAAVAMSAVVGKLLRRS